ncbi:MAG: hypothetical protein AAGC95_02080 [Pseudomonadota bacterium]
MTRIAALFVVFTLAACASKPPEDPRIAEVAGGVERTKTEFDHFTRFEGPRHPIGGADGWMLIRSWYDVKTDRFTHQLYVRVNYEGEAREYQYADYPGGKPAEIKVLEQDLDCPTGATSSAPCMWEEHVGLPVAHKELKRHVRRKESLRYRIVARKGAPVVIETPSYYLKGYLRAIDAAS